ncbi:hypothetical protein [Ilumatobacter coccineus]|uniref:Uncharacterized protein n=1 Tax=Ilumatobacter coccineus (strain NBRC 103263 / KCTC 29153 / YM16-304) TaxID=1313172 RepID=A0A6C7E6B4_ILUCY|nr:hypothetical protein [Ilumatobacter coccineus]BAN02051.1 hypothetical protein YM304_17370 [Ilumatobacter coccineus YM16-304]
MAFGESSGPPASARQLRELLELLEAAGHSGYRDARGPMGFTQRQAGGKFTTSEADEFIERLQIEIHGDGPPAGSHAPPPSRAPKPTSPTSSGPAAPLRPAARRPVPRATPTPDTGTPSSASAGPSSLADVPVEELAAELQRRGWIVIEP